MRALLWGRLKGFRKQWVLYLIMLILPIVFTYFFSMMGDQSKYNVSIVFDQDVTIQEKLVAELKNEESLHIEKVSISEMEEGIVNGGYEAGIHFDEEALNKIEQGKGPIDLVIYRTKDGASLELIEQAIMKAVNRVVNQQQLSRTIVAEMGGNLSLRNVSQLVQHAYQKELPVTVQASTLESEAEVKYNPQFQALVGFTLFFTIYTIIFTLGEILEDRSKNILSRITIAPVSTTKWFMANFIYSFLVGYSQIFILVLFGKYVMNMDWGEHLILLFTVLAFYVMATMAIGMLLCGFSKNMQQLNAITPIVAVSFAMIGGAYWPIEIVSNEVLLKLANITPIYHAMNALKSLVLYDRGVIAILPESLSLLGMTLILIVIGILLFKKQSKT